MRAKGLKPGDADWPDPERRKGCGYNGDYIADIAEDFKAKEDGESRTTARSPPAAMSRT
jgi:arginyl-tRNA synthetase